MAVGDDAVQAGFEIVPSTGSEEARVRYGAREINRTRDYIARLVSLVPSTKAQGRALSGISSGTTVPANTVGEDGDIFFRIV